MSRREEDITDEKLMLYLDGELSREDGRDVERALERPEVRARVEALAQMGDVVRARVAAAEEDAAPQLAAMWERVRADLGPAAAPARPRPALWARMREWLESYRSHMMTGAVAAATGALLAVFLTGGRERIVYVPERTPAAPAAQEAEVESLEVLGGSGTVFHFPGESPHGEGTTVVWVTQNDEPDDAPTTGGPI